MKYTIEKAIGNCPELDKKIESLEKGDLVKLVFLFDGKNGEGLWVVITDIDSEKLTGKVDNSPISDALEMGESVVFSKENIVRIKK